MKHWVNRFTIWALLLALPTTSLIKLMIDNQHTIIDCVLLYSGIQQYCLSCSVLQSLLLLSGELIITYSIVSESVRSLIAYTVRLWMRICLHMNHWVTASCLLYITWSCFLFTKVLNSSYSIRFVSSVAVCHAPLNSVILIVLIACLVNKLVFLSVTHLEV